ncbi:MAG TPA: AraC family transcriptional regulator [Bacteroidales bacterium]|nr:AraC family transcriptional regulator [Bacteroidales bacterium]
MLQITTKTIYFERINKVLVYIDRNLGEKMDLEMLASMAHFSPFHFHKIMRAYLRESLGSYIIRVRLDTAASLLIYSREPVSDIAYRIGYDTPAAFTKAFQKRFGTSPSDYRQNKGSLRLEKVELSTFNFKAMNLKPKIKEIKPIPVVYVHAIGDYNNVGPAWEKLAKFMKEKKLFSFGMDFIGVSYDDPSVTETEKLRYDACVTVKKEIRPEGEVGYKVLEGGLYAIFRHTGPYENFSKTYDQIYLNWLPESGYELRNEPPLEFYLNDPDRTLPENLKTDIYVPVKREA